VTAPHANGQWLVCPKPSGRARIKLFCFPFAGGSSLVFHTWSGALPSSVEVTAIELPGRRRRYYEAPLRSVSAVVERLVPELASALDRPYMMFGHSLGALIAFETVRALARLGLPLPTLLMPSASVAPHLGSWLAPMHDLPRAEFLSRLGALGGTPPEVLANDDLVDLVLKALRADFEVLASYRYEPGPPLRCPMLAFAGDDDCTIPPGDVAAWRVHTRSFRSYTLPGDHFFLKGNQKALLALIERELPAAGG